MPLYESVFIVRPDVSSSQVETLAQEMSTIIEENGGSVPKVEHWGLKNLSYRIKKNRKAYYVLFNIDSPHAAVAEMERNMSIHEDVLRHMTLRLDELEEGPSIMMQNKASRDDRRPRGGDRGGYGGKRSDERKPEEAKAEEPKSKEAAAEEPKSEEAAAEEPKSEEAKDAAAKPADDAATETAPDTATETATETASADNASETTAAGEDK